MSCARPDLKERLIGLVGSDGELADPETRAHAAQCDSCKPELASLLEGWHLLAASSVAPPSEALLSRVRARVLTEAPIPSRPMVPFALAGLAAVAGLALVFKSQAGLQLGAWISTAILVAAYALGLAAAKGVRRAEAPFLAVTSAGLLASVLSQPGSALGPGVCLALGSVISLVPLFITALALRGASPLGAQRVGALAGAAAGTLGVALWRLHCPIGGYWHALCFHATVVPVVAAIGALLGRRLFSPLAKVDSSS